MPSSATTTPANHTPSLHDALPIFRSGGLCCCVCCYGAGGSWHGYASHGRHSGCRHEHQVGPRGPCAPQGPVARLGELRGYQGCRCRSEEHTSELQSRRDIVCRLLPPPPPRTTLHPYTTLFRSSEAAASAAASAATVQAAAGTATPLMDGTAAVGTSTKWAHEDHVHPKDPSLASVSYVDTKVAGVDRKSTRLNSSHVEISYAVFCHHHPREPHSIPTRRSSDLPKRRPLLLRLLLRCRRQLARLRLSWTAQRLSARAPSGPTRTMCTPRTRRSPR